MGGFVRVFSSKNGASGSSSNVSSQIMFDNPVILYSYDNDSYSVTANKKGFIFKETEDHNVNDNEGVALFVAGLDPAKDYIVSFTLRANKALNTTSGSYSNAVGFTQSFGNIKKQTETQTAKRIFAITNNQFNQAFKRMSFDNGTIQDTGGTGSVSMTNYIPITSVSTTPTEYSLTIRKGCNGSAILCFELAYPNSGGHTYYFENFNIVDAEAPVSEGEPLSLYCFSAETAHINGYTKITNWISKDDPEPYQLIKINVKGKCMNGKVQIKMRNEINTSYLNNDILIGEISQQSDIDVTYTVGIASGGSAWSSNYTTIITGTYIPGVYNSGSVTPYTPVNGVYSDDEIEISCIATGTASASLVNSYQNPSKNLYNSDIATQALAEQIATDVGITLDSYEYNWADYTTYEDTQIVINRAANMQYLLRPTNNTPIPLSRPTIPDVYSFTEET